MSNQVYNFLQVIMRTPLLPPRWHATVIIDALVINTVCTIVGIKSESQIITFFFDITCDANCKNIHFLCSEQIPVKTIYLRSGAAIKKCFCFSHNTQLDPVYLLVWPFGNTGSQSRYTLPTHPSTLQPRSRGTDDKDDLQNWTLEQYSRELYDS